MATAGLTIRFSATCGSPASPGGRWLVLPAVITGWKRGWGPVLVVVASLRSAVLGPDAAGLH
jgi:hypothetical protein